MREEGVDSLLHDFLTTVNKMSVEGMEMTINGIVENIKGMLVMVSADTLAANWLGKFKEGVAFALKNCRNCNVTGTQLKNKFVD